MSKLTRPHEAGPDQLTFTPSAARTSGPTISTQTQESVFSLEPFLFADTSNGIPDTAWRYEVVGDDLDGLNIQRFSCKRLKASSNKFEESGKRSTAVIADICAFLCLSPDAEKRVSEGSKTLYTDFGWASAVKMKSKSAEQNGTSTWLIPIPDTLQGSEHRELQDTHIQYITKVLQELTKHVATDTATYAASQSDQLNKPTLLSDLQSIEVMLVDTKGRGTGSHHSMSSLPNPVDVSNRSAAAQELAKTLETFTKTVNQHPYRRALNMRDLSCRFVLPTYSMK